MTRWAIIVLAFVAACEDERVFSHACSGADCTARVHPADFADRFSANFHGTYLREHDWDFALCQGCHGTDYAGGKAGVSCLQCHADGPTACTTCHGPTGPTSNAHPTHHAAQVDCSNCHIKPTSWDDPGHIVGVSGPPPIVFGAAANLTIDPADRHGPPTWDGAKCTNVYCHGDVLHAAGGTLTQPRWDDPTPAGGCTTCHGAPPPNHQRADCATCHPANAPHRDGIVQVGRTSGCDGCHGSASSPAPPTDLSGNTLTTAIGVGAHQAHLNSSFLRGPIACDTCHLVPTNVTDPGHLAPPPAAVTIAWNRTTQTCDTWCHGGTSPVWTTSGTATCGSCHGIPPADAPHTPAMTFADCTNCHPVFPAQHMNGVVDVH